MNTKIGSVLVAVACLVAANASGGDKGSDDGKRESRFAAKLKPTNEVPALSSEASGSFKLIVNEANQTLSFELSYEDLEAPTTAAHIHVGQKDVNGGISVFLCGTAPEGFPAVDPCPPAPATVTGIITPANIIGPVPQGIEASTMDAHEFDELVKLIRRGVTYANVHSARFPGGEIRGQILSADKRR
jgi:hypothetical protein